MWRHARLPALEDEERESQNKISKIGVLFPQNLGEFLTSEWCSAFFYFWPNKANSSGTKRDFLIHVMDSNDIWPVHIVLKRTTKYPIKRFCLPLVDAVSFGCLLLEELRNIHLVSVGTFVCQLKLYLSSARVQIQQAAWRWSHYIGMMLQFK